MADYNGKKITRVLFCGVHFPASYNYTKDYLKDCPWIQVDCVPHSGVPDVIQNYDIWVIITMRIDSTIISRASQLKLLIVFGVGLDGVDIEAATRCGIKVARIRTDGTGSAAACAEMAIYLMLGLLRKQNELRVSVKQKKLGEPIGETLLGKTVFILGCGNIGIELAKRLQPFGVKITATKRNWTSKLQPKWAPVANGFIQDMVHEKGLHGDIYEFAGKADIVVVCLMLNMETEAIVNKSFISSMRKGALLVNIARGGLMDYRLS
ncbi:D-3-phosphoglycerate dehydrogenase [Euphorbia peplus]|nr:D-3-phosphoglycerate dehydrogenase [Euphorbia peplus]